MLKDTNNAVVHYVHDAVCLILLFRSCDGGKRLHASQSINELSQFERVVFLDVNIRHPPTRTIIQTLSFVRPWEVETNTIHLVFPPHFFSSFFLLYLSSSINPPSFPFK